MVESLRYPANVHFGCFSVTPFTCAVLINAATTYRSTQPNSNALAINVTKLRDLCRNAPTPDWCAQLETRNHRSDKCSHQRWLTALGRLVRHRVPPHGGIDGEINSTLALDIWCLTCSRRTAPLSAYAQHKIELARPRIEPLRTLESFSFNFLSKSC